MLKSIEENYTIENLDDFDLFDASFLFDKLHLLKIKPGMTIGFYRKQDETVDRSFVATPYVHDTNADQLYKPIITPKKKTFTQRLGISSEPYSTKYLLRGVVDRRALKDLNGGNALRIGQYISLPNNEEAVWQMFLLDNIEYFLPKFDHGAYKDRKIVFSLNDTKDLPLSIQQYVQHNSTLIYPTILINNTKELVVVRCVYFNKWQGLVRWTCFYMMLGGHAKDPNAKNLIRIIQIKHKETYDILVKYDCGDRY